MINGSNDTFHQKTTINNYDSKTNSFNISDSSFLPSLDLKPMGDKSNAVFKNFGVINKDSEFEIQKLNKFFEISLSVRERINGTDYFYRIPWKMCSTKDF